MPIIKMLILCDLRKNAEKRKVQSHIILVQFGIISWHWWYNPIITDYTLGAGKPLFLCPETAWKRPKTTKNNALDHFRGLTKMMPTILLTPAKRCATHAFWRDFETPLKGVFSCTQNGTFWPKNGFGYSIGYSIGYSKHEKKRLDFNPLLYGNKTSCTLY